MKEIIFKKKLSKIALLGIDPQVFHILHKHSTTNLCPWVPWFKFSFILFIFNNVCVYVGVPTCVQVLMEAKDVKYPEVTGHGGLLVLGALFPLGEWSVLLTAATSVVLTHALKS